MFNLMKTIKEIMKEANRSRQVIYIRIKRLEELEGDNLKKYYTDGRTSERMFPDDQAEWLINGALPTGRPKKVYREE